MQHRRCSQGLACVLVDQAMQEVWVGGSHLRQEIDSSDILFVCSQAAAAATSSSVVAINDNGAISGSGSS